MVHSFTRTRLQALQHIQANMLGQQQRKSWWDISSLMLDFSRIRRNIHKVKTKPPLHIPNSNNSNNIFWLQIYVSIWLKWLGNQKHKLCFNSWYQQVPLRHIREVWQKSSECQKQWSLAIGLPAWEKYNLHFVSMNIKQALALQAAVSQEELPISFQNIFFFMPIYFYSVI